MYDAIIVGGGPVGSRVAGRLAEKGHKVLVLEKNARPGLKTACTGIIGEECVRTLEIPDKCIYRKLNSATLFSPSGNRLHLYRPETQAVVLDRPAFDTEMAARAQKVGAEYSFNSRATGVNIEHDRVAVAATREGKSYVIEGKVAVITCGFNPGLIDILGLGGFKDFVGGAQAEVEAPGDEVEVYFGGIAPGFFAWLVPAAPGIAKAGLLSRGNPGFYLKKWLADLTSRGKIASAEVKISYGGIPLKPLTRAYGERMIAVGDAAGQVKPTTGGGIYYGLLSADIAADTLHQALEDDDLAGKRLARYERGWRKKLGRELRTDYWFRKLFERLSDRQIDRTFRIIKAGGIDEALLKAEDLSFDWHGRTIMRLLKYQVVAKTIGHIKMPFNGV